MLSNVSRLYQSWPATRHITFANLQILFSSGILRYRVDFQGMEYQGEDDEFFDLDDY